jgi:hypothetical protein
MPEAIESVDYLELDTRSKGERFRAAYERFAELSRDDITTKGDAQGVLAQVGIKNPSRELVLDTYWTGKGQCTSPMRSSVGPLLENDLREEDARRINEQIDNYLKENKVNGKDF